MKRMALRAGLLVVAVMVLCGGFVAAGWCDRAEASAGVRVRAFGLRYNGIVLAPDTTLQMQPLYAPANANAGREVAKWSVVYNTDPENPVTIDENGLVSAGKSNLALARVMAETTGGLRAWCWVWVRNAKVSAIRMRYRNISTYLDYDSQKNGGRQVPLAATVAFAPYYAANKGLDWFSSNENVATVSSDGTVTLKNEGAVIITARTQDGSNRYDRCVIRVSGIRARLLTVANGALATLDQGVTADVIGANVLPANATYKDCAYKSLNTDIVQVDPATGKITTVGPGVALIQVTADKGRIGRYFKVQVRSSKPRTFTISAIGDMVMGDDPRRPSTFYRYFLQYVRDGRNVFENAKPYFDQTTMTIANLEVPLTNKKRSVSSKVKYHFRGRPQDAQHIKAGGIDWVNLANNHVDDHGGYADTKRSVQWAGLGFNGFNLKEAKIISVGDGENAVKVGMIGFQTGPRNATNARIRKEVAWLKARVDVVIVSMHFCDVPMYTNVTRNVQRAHAYVAIDAGADVILGHHQTYISGLEVYKGKYIAYGLGTFVSAGDQAFGTRETFILQQKFSVHGEGANFVESSDLTIIPFWNSTTAAYNDVMPTRPSSEARSAVITKIRRFSADPNIAFDVK